jgi:hypothetical protein
VYKPLATISQGVTNTFNPDFTRAEITPGHTPGLIEKAGNFITDKAIPTTLRTVGGALSSLAGVAQSAGSTGLKLGSDIYHGLAGRDIGDYDPTITKYNDTWHH